MTNADKPAMPQSAKEDGYGCNYGDGINQVPTGLTKREMFAIHTMNGYLSNDVMQKSGISFKEVAEKAVLMADVLLAELEK